MRQKPFFMIDENWYYFDEQEFCYKLKNDAPEEAVKSYKEFYNAGDDETVIC